MTPSWKLFLFFVAAGLVTNLAQRCIDLLTFVLLVRG